MKMKMEKAAFIGIETVLHRFEEDVTEEVLIDEVLRLNEAPEVNGIMVQMPLPKGIEVSRVLEIIRPVKDVDGLNIPSLKESLTVPAERHFPATAKAVMEILTYYNVPLKGKVVVVLGSSLYVGRPVAAGLLYEGAEVNLCDINTGNNDSKIRSADVVVSCTGVYGIVSEKNAKPGSVIIDVGINFIEGKMVGDVDYTSVTGLCAAISPVPGGVGPVTIACLLSNTLKAYKQQNEL